MGLWASRLGGALSVDTEPRAGQAGWACTESWLAPSPSMLGFPFVSKISIWSQSNRLETSCVKTVWGEPWTTSAAVSWDVTGGDEACRGRRKKNKCFGLVTRLFFPALAARGMLGVESCWKGEFFWQRHASPLTTPHCEEDLAPKQSNSVLRSSLPKICLRGEK